MKKLLIIALAIITMASCKKEELVLPTPPSKPDSTINVIDTTNHNPIDTTTVKNDSIRTYIANYINCTSVSYYINNKVVYINNTPPSYFMVIITCKIGDYLVVSGSTSNHSNTRDVYLYSETNQLLGHSSEVYWYKGCNVIYTAK